MNSSAIRSRQACEPSARGMSSAASTCQVSWGPAARRDAAAAGRRPRGAGPRPAAANQRCKERVPGGGSMPRPRRMTRIRPAPQAGCSRRSIRAASRAGCSASEPGAGPGRPAAKASGPRRARRRSPRTARGLREKASASSLAEAPSRWRSRIAWRIGRGTGRGIAGYLHGAASEDGPTSPPSCRRRPRGERLWPNSRQTTVAEFPANNCGRISGEQLWRVTLRPATATRRRE
ncbi:hypothetical protein OJF2_76780 [Aquisphaera giovannonii]|uniref:Uncharacterized protein n=1 Tax=Aquisphaera giovannonii TaxID=406548 RepID=A0A5B9WEI1_9BACT|nr:hypothetical protein OJF2_76780 [Aquisphaera giovannonii]